jgi:hypothetical protein
VTPLEFEAFARRITFVNPPYPTELRVASGWDGVEVSIRVMPNDRDTGRPRLLVLTRHYNAAFIDHLDERRAALMMLREVRDAYAHEADEAFRLDGVRVFDPHGDERTVGP